ncbi:MAG TPA: lipase, partial [Candidatus Competibacteraceae bacterium]|nr:lipase [Candidatus Competibacteraceae bacterium]
MRPRLALILATTPLLLSACGHDDDSDILAPPPTTATIATFDPSPGSPALPFPIDLLFGADGTLNIPVSDPDDYSDPRVALNALDGFSTVAPITTSFSAAVDASSLVAGVTVRMFEVRLSAAAGHVTQIVRELQGNREFAVSLAPDPSRRNLVILPLAPLAPKTSYLVALSNGIRDFAGRPIGPSAAYQLSRQDSSTFVQAQETALAAFGVDRNSLVLSWSFSTQSINDVLAAVRAQARPQAAQLRATGLDTAALGKGLPGLAAIYAGTLQLPYYLQRNAPLSGFWKAADGTSVTRHAPQPVASETLSVPLLATLPDSDSGRRKPAGGWPVVIFQHGITRDRSDMLAIADSLAAAGFAVVAMDLPLHGITDAASPFHTPLERTFELDLVNNVSDAPSPDGLADPSGTHFINLASLLTSRDNVRQGVADLFQLTATVPTLDFDGDGSPDLDGSRIHYLGHSLGGIVGSTFLGLDTTVGAATLAMPGGGIAKLLDASPTFGPAIQAGLATKGLIKGSAAYESFLASAQAVVDAADPVNYAVAAADNHPLHMIEVVGGAGALPDQVIPNSVPDAPLSGTEPLARLMRLSAVTASVQDPA